MATGVFPLLIGRATRLAQFFGKADKVYEGTIQFGYSTDTYDAEGKPTSERSRSDLDCDAYRRAPDEVSGQNPAGTAPGFGEEDSGNAGLQTCAKEYRGETRSGRGRDSFDRTCCDAKGTRSMCECIADRGRIFAALRTILGRFLGLGAFLKRLRRTASGGFDLQMSRTLDELAVLSEEGRISEALIPAADLLPEFPSEHVDAATAGFIRQGRDFRVSPFRVAAVRYVKAVSQEGELLAIGEAKLPNLYHPISSSLAKE